MAPWPSRIAAQEGDLLRTLSRQMDWHCQPTTFLLPSLLSQAPHPILPKLKLGLSMLEREIFSTLCTRCLWNVQTALTAGSSKPSSLNAPSQVLTMRLPQDIQLLRNTIILTIVRVRGSNARQSSADGKERTDFPSQSPHFHLTFSIRSFHPPGLPSKHKRTRSWREITHDPLLLFIFRHKRKPLHTRGLHL